MKQTNSTHRFVVCIKNQGYAASLEVRKIYRVLPDAPAAKHHMIRVVDESGEDYLYPCSYFSAIRVPSVAAKAFAMAE
jgi:hypothetical protein